MPILGGSFTDKKSFKTRVNKLLKKNRNAVCNLTIPNYGNIRIDQETIKELINKLEEPNGKISIQGKDGRFIDQLNSTQTPKKNQRWNDKTNPILKTSEPLSILIVAPPARPTGGSGQIDLANILAERGHQVSLLTLSDVMPEFFFELHPDIKSYNLNLKLNETLQARIDNIHFLKFAHVLFDSKPDVLLSFRLVMNKKLLDTAKRLGIPAIVAYRGGIELKYKIKRRKIRKIFSAADAISLMLPEYKKFIPKKMRDKVLINKLMLTCELNPTKNSIARSDTNILYIGRLEKEKNVSMLISAFQILSKTHDYLTLNIVGEGTQRTALEKQANNDPHIKFWGFQASLSEFYLSSTVLALPSYSEGIPNVIIEALAHKLPVVCFKHIAGNNFLIKNKKNGLLMPHYWSNRKNKSVLTNTLETIFSDKNLKKQMTNNLQESSEPILEEFSIHRFLSDWELTINTALSQKQITNPTISSSKKNLINLASIHVEKLSTSRRIKRMLAKLAFRLAGR